MSQENISILLSTLWDWLVNHLLEVGVVVILLIIIIIIIIISRKRCRKGKIASINFDALTGKEFEEFCAILLRKNGFEKVEVTKASGDHGADIIAYWDDVKYAIQCKRYETNIGNSAVQQIYAAKSIYGADVAVVLTNRAFTKQAVEEAECLRVKLWERSKLKQLIVAADAPKRKKGKYL